MKHSAELFILLFLLLPSTSIDSPISSQRANNALNDQKSKKCYPAPRKAILKSYVQVTNYVQNQTILKGEDRISFLRDSGSDSYQYLEDFSTGSGAVASMKERTPI